MNVLFRLLATLFLSFTFIFYGFSQHKVVEYDISFAKKTSNNQKVLSKKQKIELPETISFVSISAYILDKECNSKLSYRLKFDSGWSEWNSLSKNTHDITPDRVVYLGEAIYNEFTAIQFKSNISLNKTVRFRLFIPQSYNISTDLEQKLFTECNCPTPDICDRDCWCPTCPVDATPTSTTPTHIVIHHSAFNNTSDDFAGVVASYYDYHVNSNGWDDIGYNFLIDPNGVIYEGRGNGVQGAHFSCMNTNTVGICVIGNYQTEAPQPETIQHLLDFLAWEACLYDIDVADYSYLPLADMDIMNVCGHRDGNESVSPNSCASGTDCPGDVLYGLIPTFRDLLSYFSCLQESVGVEEFKGEDEVEIFPNPVNTQINVKANFLFSGSVGIVEIYDMQGKRVYFKSKMIYTNGLLEINDCDQLNKGTYIFYFHNQKGNIKKEFIKE